MALLDETDCNDILGHIAELVSLLEGQDWGTDEPGYNEALSRLEAFRKQIIVISVDAPDEDEDDSEDDPADEPTAA